jgi:hypothetical protein
VNAAVSDAVWIEDGPVTGDYHARTVLLGNEMDRRCTRSGTPELVATDAATGLRGPLPSVAGTPADGGTKQYPATVDPGEPARFDVVTVASCGEPGPRLRYRDVAVVVGGREYPLDGVELETACPVRVGSWYVQPPLLNAALMVSLQAPPQVRRGTWYEYTIVLLNPQSRPFPLRPCPAYTQRLGAAVGGGAYWRLNCAVEQIPPHGMLRFAMSIWVSADTPPGPTKLHWMAVTANGQVAIAELATDGIAVEVVD